MQKINAEIWVFFVQIHNNNNKNDYILGADYTSFIVRFPISLS